MKPVDPRLLRHARATRGFLAASVLLGLIGAGLVIAQAMLIAEVVAGAFAEGRAPGELAGALWLLAATALGRGAVAWLTEVLAHRTSAAVKSQLRMRLLERAAELGPSWLSTQRTGELTTLATRGVDALDDYFSRYLPQLGLAVVVPAAVLARIVGADWISAAVIAGTIPLIPIFMILIGLATQRQMDRQWRTLARLSGHFLDVVAGLPTLKVFGRAKAQTAAIRKITDDYRRATLRTLRIAFLSSFALELLATLSVALVAVGIGMRLVHGDLDLRTGLLVLVLAPEAYLPLRLVGERFHASAEGMAAAGEVFQALETEPPAAGSGAVPERPSITFEKVTVRYPGRDGAALDEVSCTVEPGECVALVGPSGSGKSTLLHALLGFRAVDGGRVLIGGQELGTLDAREWRSRIAWVPQRPYLFAGTIAENVRLARPEADTAALDEALRQAGAAEFVAALPDGAQTRLGEDGAGLSAGQRQRLALARAFLADREILLLDEPTAALDGETEAQVAEAVARLARSRTVILVLHRPALRALADRVIHLPAPPIGPATPRELPRDASRPAPSVGVSGSGVPVQADGSVAQDGASGGSGGIPVGGVDSMVSGGPFGGAAAVVPVASRGASAASSRLAPSVGVPGPGVPVQADGPAAQDGASGGSGGIPVGGVGGVGGVGSVVSGGPFGGAAAVVPATPSGASAASSRLAPSVGVSGSGVPGRADGSVAQDGVSEDSGGIPVGGVGSVGGVVSGGRFGGAAAVVPAVPRGASAASSRPAPPVGVSEPGVPGQADGSDSAGARDASRSVASVGGSGVERTDSRGGASAEGVDEAVPRSAGGWLWRVARPVRRRLGLAALLGACATASAVGLMGTSGWLISRASQQPPVLYLMVAVTAVRAFGIGRGVFRYGERLLSHDAVFRILADLRAGVYRRLERLAPAGLPAFRRGDLLSRLVADVDALQDHYLRWLMPAAVAGTVGTAAALAVGAMLPAAGAALAVGLLLGGLAVPALTGRLSRRTERQLAPAKGRLSSTVVDLLAGSAELEATGATPRQLAAVRERDAELTRLAAASAATTGLGSGLLTLLTGVSAAATGALGVSAVHAGRMDGLLLAVVMLTPLAAFEAVNGLPLAAQHRQRSARAAQRILELSRLDPPVREPAEPAAPPADPFPLTVRALHARWPGRSTDALADIDLELTRGRRIAVVGPSGSGKSTLAAALLRFIEPTAGQFALAGTDAATLDGDEVRRIVGLCAQDSHLFDSSIRENLRLAAPDADDAALRRALAAARLLDWVDGLPEGLGTAVGEHGAALSGGQRQRLALARALLADFPVLVLDEPAEHLDLATADALTADLLAATAERTTVVITHRLAGLDAAGLDEIVVLDAGRIVQRGTWPQLAAAEGPFRTAWQREQETARLLRDAGHEAEHEAGTVSVPV